MKVALFSQSLLSCWNHGNAHFLRGVVRELIRRGHSVRAFEPEDSWSRGNLVRAHGAAVLQEVRAAYPELPVEIYDVQCLDLDRMLEGVDLVIAHEWNEPALIARLGARRKAQGRFLLMFHDTHHRTVSSPEQIRRFDLSGYDVVLAFGEVIRERYERLGWGRHAVTWHEAADTTTFRPIGGRSREGEVTWIGNWGDEERTNELREFLIDPVAELQLGALVHGVRYPSAGRRALRAAGIRYGGWLPNHRVPDVFARYALTVHIPRRPYRHALPGIPTIRVFEALACGIPLISAPWDDVEGLFGDECFVSVRDGPEMVGALRLVLNDSDLRGRLVANGLAAIRDRHSCAHRVDELEAICHRVAGRNMAASAPMRGAA